MPKAKQVTSEYPPMWMSREVFTGSRTDDPGERFYLQIDANGIAAHRWSGMMDIYLYWQAYWPKTVIWKGTSPSLDGLLRKLGREKRLGYRLLLEKLTQDDDLYDYLLWERLPTAKRNKLKSPIDGDNRQAWRYMGIPSPQILKGSHFDCLEIERKQGRWTVRLFSDGREGLPDPLHACVIGDHYRYPDFNTMVTCSHLSLPWNGHKLASMLVEHDPRWRSFIDACWFEPRTDGRWNEVYLEVPTCARCGRRGKCLANQRVPITMSYS